MSSIRGSLLSVIPPNEKRGLQKYIQSAVNTLLYQKLRLNRRRIENAIKAEIKRMFQSYHEVHELIYGQLRYDLGITLEEAISVTNQIPEILGQMLHFEFIRNDGGVSASVSIVRDDYTDILNIKEAVFEHTEATSRNPGVPIHWLEWLLLGGPGIIVHDYRVKYINTDRSRSGGALMIHPGGGWRVPPPFDGIASNNMITRALAGIDAFILAEIQKVL